MSRMLRFPPVPTFFTEFQVQAVLERVLRRPLWKVWRQGDSWFACPTKQEQAVAIPVDVFAESMTTGNYHPTRRMELLLLRFPDTGIPDRDGNDITGRFRSLIPPESIPTFSDDSTDDR